MDDALRLCSALDPTYINGQSHIDALWRMMLADQVSLPAGCFHHFRCWLLWHLGQALGSGVQRITDVLKSIVYRMAVLIGSAQSEEDFLLTPQQVVLYATQYYAKPEKRTVEVDAINEKIQEDGLLFGRLVKGLWLYRRLYTTSKGYIGLGPLSTQVGDEVWVICDARTPFILHPQQENSNVPDNAVKTGEVKQFQLVGETYLHGFMHGEALKSGLLDQLRWIDLI